jgi:cell division septation protein DedD
MPTMITFRAGRTVLFAALVTLAACSSEQQDWRSAEAAGTIEAYGRFIEQHPGSELATQARARVAELTEDRDWQQATKVATVDAYRAFLGQHPNGRWSQEARIRIESFALGSIPRMQPQNPSLAPPSRASGVRLLQLASAGPTPVMGVSAQPSAGASAAVVASSGGYPAPSSTGYAVQLGAFSSPAGADRAWQRLQSRFGAQLSGLSPHVVAADTSSGQLYRLQASASGEVQARAICDSLRQHAQSCVPVLPR